MAPCGGRPAPGGTRTVSPARTRYADPGRSPRGAAAGLTLAVATSLPPRSDPAKNPSPAERRQRLHQLRALKMARGAHAFVRGSTERFYDWIASVGGIHLPEGPAV